MSVDVLIPTFRRPAALAVTLTALAAQTEPGLRVVIADQTPPAERGSDDPVVQTPLRLLQARGVIVEVHRRRARLGLAEQRQFLLERARAPYALFLDDDVVLEPDVLARLVRVIRWQRCGFVGAPLVGLSYLHDVRLHQQAIELWQGPVEPEVVRPDTPAWERHHLHSAANAWHVQAALGATDAEPVVYKVAWVGGCVLYDVAKLRGVGGFGFWRDLPVDHAGEDVLAQLRVMARFGGCGVLPSGAYHQELETTVTDRRVDAPLVLPLEPSLPRV